MAPTERAKAVFLAGGFGSRLNHVTNPRYNRNAIPKPLLPIANVSMIQRGVDAIKAAGVDRFYSTTAVMADIVHETFPGRVSVQTAKPGSLSPVAYKHGGGDFREHFYEAEPLGTAPGVIWAAQQRGLRGSIIIPSGDIVTALNVGRLLEEHQKAVRDHGAVATIALNPVPIEDLYRFGTVRLDGMQEHPLDLAHEIVWFQRTMDQVADNFGRSVKVLEFAEKRPGTIQEFERKNPDDALAQDSLALSPLNNSSYYVLEATDENLALIASWLKLRPDCNGPAFNDFGAHVLPRLAQMGRLYGFPFSEYWSDVGTKRAYWQTQWEALDPDNGLKVDLGRAHVQIPSSAVIRENVLIGRDVRIADGAEIGPNVVIGDGWSIGKNARISDSVLVSRSIRTSVGFEVRDGVTISNAIVGSGPVDRDVVDDVAMHDGTSMLLEKHDILEKPKEYFNP